MPVQVALCVRGNMNDNQQFYLVDNINFISLVQTINYFKGETMAEILRSLFPHQS